MREARQDWVTFDRWGRGASVVTVVDPNLGPVVHADVELGRARGRAFDFGVGMGDRALAADADLAEGLVQADVVQGLAVG